MASYKTSVPTVSTVLDTRYIREDDRRPVKLRVTFERKRRYYSISDEDSSTGETLFLTPLEFKAVTSTAVKSLRLKRIKTLIQSNESAARDTAESIMPFSWEGFVASFFEGKAATGTLNDLMEKHIEELKEDEAIGTAVTFKNSLSNIKKFTGDKVVHLSEVTPDWLKKWKKHMSKKHLSATTISMYLRCVRVMMNKAKKKKLIKPEQYPFTESDLIPSAVNVKKALTLEQLGMIYRYKPLEGSREHQSRDLWMFSYLCNGMNMKDVARLRYTDVKKDKLEFKRAKTSRTKEKTITAFLKPEVKAIIERWGNPRGINNYVFNILSSGITAEEEHKRIRQEIKTINKYMDRICEGLGIEEKVTTYFARHSWATIMKRAGVPISFISEKLGHSNMKTTENYLGSFDDESMKKYADESTAGFADEQTG
jgi:integrase/recombinase XerD